MQLLPAIRGATSSRAREAALRRRVAEGARVRRLERRARARQVGAPCPDHLVHTKRVPLWVPFDPRVDDAEALAKRIARASPRTSARPIARTSRVRAGDRRPMDPDARVVLVQHLGLVGVGPTLAAAQPLARPLPPRDGGDGRGARARPLRLADAAESFAVEYWPLELYKLSLAPPPRELQGRIALVTGAAGGIGRAIVDALAELGAAVVAFDLDGEGARGRDRRSRRRGPGGAGRRHERGGSRRAFPRRSSASAASTSWSRTPASPRARRSRRRPWPTGTAATRSSAPATSWSRARPSACCGSRAGRLDRLRGVQERARRRPQRRGLLVGQGGGAASRPLPRRGGRGPGSASTR